VTGAPLVRETSVLRGRCRSAAPDPDQQDDIA
jgi:hypothetical protein